MAMFDQRHQNVTTQYNADQITIYHTDTTVGDAQFRRNRSQMLERVRLMWIKGFLEDPSLYHLARIELGLETRPDMVVRPFDLLVQRPQQVPQPLPTGIPISHVFDEAGEALLILGEPGAGKTTLLLELTRDLLDRAVRDENHLIPVVFHLSSWAEQRLALANWLIDELNKQYDVPHTRAKTWVDAGLILPLLDGLDEVAADHRDVCVETINAFLNEHGPLPMVVCSRVADYEALTLRLRLPSAVLIQSLSRQQVASYVEQAGASLAGLRTMLQTDETIWELLNTPLMLSIVALAYHGRSADEMRSSGILEEHRSQLFAAYTDAMFHRRAKATPYTREQTERWLTWLAKAMKAHNQSVFYLEWMQPDWMPGQKQQRLVTFIMSIMSGLVFGPVFGLVFGLLGGLAGGLVGGLSVGIRSPLVGGLVVGLVAGLVGWLVNGPFSGLVFGLLFGLIGGLGVRLVGYSKEIKPVEKVRWSWSAARYKWLTNLFKRLVLGLTLGLLGGLAGGLFSERDAGLVVVLAVGLILGLIGGLVFGLIGGLKDGFTVGEIGTQSFPNEGIRRSRRNALVIGLIGGLVFGLAVVLAVGLVVGLVGWLFGKLAVWLAAWLGVGLVYGLILGPFSGLVFGLRFGGRACLHHFALRLVLWHNNFAPFNYVRFLDYATDRIFLRKVGGGYIFIHRMLLEYFAARDQTSSEQQKCNPNG